MEAVFCLALVLIATLIAVGRYLLREPRGSGTEPVAPVEPEPSAVVPIESPVSTRPPVQTRTVDLSNVPRQFVVIDLETTGLDPNRHEIIEIGAILANRDSDTHLAFQTLVKPSRRIPRTITALTGITQEMVDREGSDLGEALASLLEFIQDLPLVTFNAQFDMAFLNTAAKKYGVTIRNRYTCALKLARKAWPGLPSYRLSELAKIGKLPHDGTHRALGDCQRALIIFTSAVSMSKKRIRWSRLPADQNAAEEVGVG